MLFPQQVLDRIANGEITMAFRRWKRPTVKSGGTLLTARGLLAIEAVDAISEGQITPEDVTQAGFDSRESLQDSLSQHTGQLFRIRFCFDGDDPRIALRNHSQLSPEELDELISRLQRLDARSSIGPWTQDVLELLAQHPETRAAQLASYSRFEKEWLKTNIRKLKNLGLTESLDEGYRLSPRGRVVYQHRELRDRPP